MTTRDRLLLVTDGVTETFNPNGDLFGREKLCEVFSEPNADSLEARMARIEKTMSTYRGSARAKDDATVILLEFGGR